jgi:predicted lipid-binding transport protein (Tim44 family)
MSFWIYLLLGILYVLSPYDLLPDFFLGGGWIDDLILLGLLARYYFAFKRRKESARAYRQSGSTSTGGRGDPSSNDPPRDRPGPVPPREPHEVLGVSRDASSDEIRAAYRRLAARYHPDKVVHLGEEFRELAEKRFKEIQQAYQELTERRP